MKVDTDAQKTTEVALSAVNFQKFLHGKLRDCGPMFHQYNDDVRDLLESDHQHILEAIEFKAFCDVFFNQDENVRKKAWLQISSSQPNFEQLVKFVKKAIFPPGTKLKEDTILKWGMIAEDVFKDNNPLKNVMKSFFLKFLAVDKRFPLLKSVPDSIKKDKDFILALVKIDGLALKEVDYELRKDQDVVSAAVAQNPVAERYSLISLNPIHKYPKPLSQDLKVLKLPDLPEKASIEHLKASLSEFIDELSQIVAKDPSKLNIIRNELGLPSNTPLDECIKKLKNYHKSLFERVEKKSGYLGTPSQGSQELVKFYKQIEVYLLHLDAFLSKEENNPPEGFIERLQLLQTQSACGARFQAETEQLFSLNCIPAESMSLDKQLALIASTEAKKAIESITKSRNVHEINIKTYQLHDFLVGDRIPKDHLAHEFEETTLLEQFFSYHTVKNLVETVQRGLKQGTQLEETFTEYLKENFLPKLTEKEKAEIPALAEEAWQENKAHKIIKFEKYQKAKAENNQQMIRLLDLPKEEMACENIEELKQYLEKKKDSFIQENTAKFAKDKQIDKLYSEYFDGNPETGEGLMKWKPSIIAKVLEKMDIIK